MTQIVTVRASSWSELFDCPARWYAKYIDGIRIPASGAAHLGTSIHASTAVFDKSRLDGAPVTADDAAGVFVDTLYHPAEDVDWSADDLNLKTAEKIGLQLHSRYCTDIAPYQDYIAVEMGCEALDVECSDGITIRLTGTTDRVRKLAEGAKGIADLKSGGRAVGSDGKAVVKGHGPQLGVYALLAENVIGEPINGAAQIIGLNTKGTAKVGTGEIENPKLTLIGDGERPGLLDHAAKMFKYGIFPGNGRSNLCSPKFCPIHNTCHYK